MLLKRHEGNIFPFCSTEVFDDENTIEICYSVERVWQKTTDYYETGFFLGQAKIVYYFLPNAIHVPILCGFIFVNVEVA